MKISVYFSVLILMTGCIPSVSQRDVEVSNVVPESAVVEQSETPFDKSLPIWYLTIEPVRVRYAAKESRAEISRNSKVNGKDAQPEKISIKSTLYRSYLAERQNQITAQLNSSLLLIKNFRVVDFEKAKENQFLLPKHQTRAKGVYVIRVLITELEDRVEEDETSVHLPGLYKDKRFNYSGVVGLDVAVVDPKKGGRILQSFPVQGTYHYAQAQNGGVLAPFSNSFEKAQSTVDNALRIALSEAAKETFRHLGEEK